MKLFRKFYVKASFLILYLIFDLSFIFTLMEIIFLIVNRIMARYCVGRAMKLETKRILVSIQLHQRVNSNRKIVILAVVLV